MQTESEGMEKTYHANRNQKKAEVPIHTSDKIYFKTKFSWHTDKTFYNGKTINISGEYPL